MLTAKSNQGFRCPHIALFYIKECFNGDQMPGLAHVRDNVNPRICAR